MKARKVKAPPRRIWLTFDLLGDPMFVATSQKKARADAAHYGSTYAGPYVLDPRTASATKVSDE